MKRLYATLYMTPSDVVTERLVLLLRILEQQDRLTDIIVGVLSSYMLIPRQ